MTRKSISKGEMRMKNTKKARILSLILMMAILLGLAPQSQPAVAATSIKWTENNDLWTNNHDPYTYSVNSNTLIRTSDAGTETLVTVKLEEWEYLRIVTCIGNYIYLCRDAVDAMGTDALIVVKYNTWKKKLFKHCAPYRTEGKYMVASKLSPSDVSATISYLWKLNGFKTKKIKKLKGYGFSALFYKNKLYYPAYTSPGMNKVTVYRYTKTGKSPKKLFTIKNKEKYGQIIVDLNQIPQKNIIIANMYGSNQKYNYQYDLKTKKLKKVKK